MKKNATQKLASLLLCFLLMCCIPVPSPKNKIIKKHIGEKIYYIPKGYFKLKDQAKDGEEKSIYVWAMYPNFSPLPASPTTLRREGVWFNNILILASFIENPKKSNKHLESVIKRNKATETSKDKYLGLIHKHQSKETFDPSWDDIFIEMKDEEIISFISCGHKDSEITVPQCQQKLWLGNFMTSISYNKKLLPHWKEIKDKTIGLLESFENPEAARSFYDTSISFDQQPATEGK